MVKKIFWFFFYLNISTIFKLSKIFNDKKHNFSSTFTSVCLIKQYVVDL